MNPRAWIWDDNKKKIAGRADDKGNFDKALPSMAELREKAKMLGIPAPVGTTKEKLYEQIKAAEK